MAPQRLTGSDRGLRQEKSSAYLSKSLTEPQSFWRKESASVITCVFFKNNCLPRFLATIANLATNQDTTFLLITNALKDDDELVNLSQEDCLHVWSCRRAQMSVALLGCPGLQAEATAASISVSSMILHISDPKGTRLQMRTWWDEKDWKGLKRHHLCALMNIIKAKFTSTFGFSVMHSVGTAAIG